MAIKIKIQTTVENKVETEVEIGSYYKNICFFWKIISETKTVAVYKTNHSDKCSVEVIDTESIFRSSLCAVPSEESEFGAAYSEVMMRIVGIAECPIFVL